jgi:hypothetical protein
MLSLARHRGERAVFKMEQADGRIEWLRRNFGGVHVALTRNWDWQFASWLELVAKYGSFDFFSNAAEIIRCNPNFFKTSDALSLPVEKMSAAQLWNLFQVYNEVTENARRTLCDCVIDVSAESHAGLETSADVFDRALDGNGQLALLFKRHMRTSSNTSSAVSSRLLGLVAELADPQKILSSEPSLLKRAWTRVI